MYSNDLLDEKFNFFSQEGPQRDKHFKLSPCWSSIIFFTVSKTASDDIQFNGFPSLLKNRLNTLQQIAVKNNTSDNFNKKRKDFI